MCRHILYEALCGPKELEDEIATRTILSGHGTTRSLEGDKAVFLKTIIPSCKATKQHMQGA